MPELTQLLPRPQMPRGWVRHALRLAWPDLVRHKVRSALTVALVMIPVAFVVGFAAFAKKRYHQLSLEVWPLPSRSGGCGCRLDYHHLWARKGPKGTHGGTGPAGVAGFYGEGLGAGGRCAGEGHGQRRGGECPHGFGESQFWCSRFCPSGLWALATHYRRSSAHPAGSGGRFAHTQHYELGRCRLPAAGDGGGDDHSSSCPCGKAPMKRQEMSGGKRPGGAGSEHKVRT